MLLLTSWNSGFEFIEYVTLLSTAKPSNLVQQDQTYAVCAGVHKQQL